MRDLSRFLTLHRHFMKSQQIDTAKSVASSFEICYKNVQLAFKNGFIDELSMPKTSLLRVQQDEVYYLGLHKTILQTMGVQAYHNSRSKYDFSFGDYQALKGEHSQSLHHLCDALQANLPVLLVTNDALKL